MLVLREVLEQERDQNRAAEYARQYIFADIQKRNRMLASETDLVREEDLRDRVLIAGVRIINIGFGFLQFGLA